MDTAENGPIRRPGLLRRFAFRFVASYLLVYNAGPIIALLPLLGRFSYLIDLGWTKVVLWAERDVLHLAALSSLEETGSGDTSFLWVRNGCMLVVALAAALAWSFFDRERRKEPLVHDFVRVCVRYTLAMILIAWYGISKFVMGGQFSQPTGIRLVESVGAMSPMGMLWTFMGSSKAYTAFSGVMEVLGGLLLLWRRTTPLGSVVSAAVILNIVLLNFCYDVPVKLFSSNLLLMAGFLAWPDLRRMANVLVLNRPTDAASLVPPWKSRAFRIFAVVLKVSVIGFLLYPCYRRIHNSGPWYKAVPGSVAELSGFWEVHTFKSDGAVVPPLLTETTRWHRVLFQRYSGGLLMNAFGPDNQRLAGWVVAPESSESKLVLGRPAKPGEIVTFAVAHPGADRLELIGKADDHALEISLKRGDQAGTRLIDRGFHWVSEAPFNR